MEIEAVLADKAYNVQEHMIEPMINRNIEVVIPLGEDSFRHEVSILSTLLTDDTPKYIIIQ